jgi:hypothetical protein
MKLLTFYIEILSVKKNKNTGVNQYTPNKNSCRMHLKIERKKKGIKGGEDQLLVTIINIELNSCFALLSFCPDCYRDKKKEAPPITNCKAVRRPSVNAALKRTKKKSRLRK